MKSKLQAQEDLSELSPVLLEIPQSGLNSYVVEQMALRHRYSKSTEAAIINDYIRAEARKALDENPRVKLIEKYRTMLICVDGEYTIKIKKLDSRLRTRNVPTRAVREFLNQQPQLDGMPERPTNLFLGYQKQEIELTTSLIYLVCPDGREVEWEWELTGTAGGGVPPTPATGIPPTPQGPRRHITPKPAKREDPSEGEAANDKKA